jgi:hypothetical protein
MKGDHNEMELELDGLDSFGSTYCLPLPCPYGYEQYKFILSLPLLSANKTPKYLRLQFFCVSAPPLLNSSDGIILICGLEMSC